MKTFSYGIRVIMFIYYKLKARLAKSFLRDFFYIVFNKTYNF